MIDPELLAKLEEINAKADKAYRVAEAVRKYLFWTGVITAALIIIPAREFTIINSNANMHIIIRFL
jgi:hypothetical protein